jgi:hypothetical protein
MSETTWYERFGDIPGIDYQTPEGIHRPQVLAEYLRPKTRRSRLDGEEFLMWPDEDGGTSASPASRWQLDSDSEGDAPPERVLQRVYQQLELPGTAIDYHFALLHAYEVVRKHVRRDARLFAELERLCLFDISLAENVRLRLAGIDDFAPPVVAFGILIELYVKNGLFDDAMDIGKRAAALDQAGHSLDTIDERIAALRTEDE